MAKPSFAQSTTVHGFNLQHFIPGVDAHSIWATNTTRMLSPGQSYVLLENNLSGGQLSTVYNRTPVKIVDKLLTTNILYSLGIADFVTTGIDIAIHPWLKGAKIHVPDPDLSDEEFVFTSVNGLVMGDVRLFSKWRLYKDTPGKWQPGVGLLVYTTLPSGQENNFGAWHTPTMGGSVILDKNFKYFNAAINLGYISVPEQMVFGLNIDDRASYSAAISVPTKVFDPVGLEFNTEINGLVQLQNASVANTPQEYRTGVRATFPNGLGFDVGGGASLNNAIGNTDYRILLSLFWKQPIKETATASQQNIAPKIELAPTQPVQSNPAMNVMASVPDANIPLQSPSTPEPAIFVGRTETESWQIPLPNNQTPETIVSSQPPPSETLEIPLAAASVPGDLPLPESSAPPHEEIATATQTPEVANPSQDDAGPPTTILATLFFTQASTALTSQQNSQLAALVTRVQNQNAGFIIEIMKSGGNAANLQKSYQRALAIKTTLIRFGFDGTKITVRTTDSRATSDQKGLAQINVLTTATETTATPDLLSAAQGPVFILNEMSAKIPSDITADDSAALKPPEPPTDIPVVKKEKKPREKLSKTKASDTMFLTTLYFTLQSITVDSHQYKYLTELAGQILSNPNIQDVIIEIEKPEAENAEPPPHAYQRADVVKNILSASGIAPDRILIRANPQTHSVELPTAERLHILGGMHSAKNRSVSKRQKPKRNYYQSDSDEVTFLLNDPFDLMSDLTVE